jgi:DNA modification methylase
MPTPSTDPPTPVYHSADARNPPVDPGSVDLIVTSPPYWQQRDYGTDGQLGQEPTPDEFVATIADCPTNWESCLADHGSVLLNIDDTYLDKSLQGIPAAVVDRARNAGWAVHERIHWAKPYCKPTPAGDRLRRTHEPLYFLSPPSGKDPYRDRVGFCAAHPTDDPTVWSVPPANGKDHAAPFPDQLVKRALDFAAPEAVCSNCGQPLTRAFPASWPPGLEDAFATVRRLESALDADPPEALEEELLEQQHRAKSRFRNGVLDVSEWNGCSCDASHRRGVVYDPFVGSGTTVQVAVEEGYCGIGSDIDPPEAEAVTPTLSSF